MPDESAAAAWTAIATLPSRERAEALGDALERMDPAPEGVGVFEMEDGSGLWEVGAYFAARPDAAGLALLEAAFGARLAVSEVPPTDWVARVRRELAPVHAGRFVLFGAHDAEVVNRSPGRVPLLIEASMAFGTGHHGSTLGCLLALDALIAEGRRFGSVLDLGCGTAVLAMAAASALPEARVLASDVDPVAIEVAEANLAANGLAGRVATRVADGVDEAVRAAAPFDLVLANILAGPLVALAPAVAALLAPGARVVLSGLLHDQAKEVSAAWRALGLAEASRAPHGDWTTLVLAAPGG